MSFSLAPPRGYMCVCQGTVFPHKFYVIPTISTVTHLRIGESRLINIRVAHVFTKTTERRINNDNTNNNGEESTAVTTGIPRRSGTDRSIQTSGNETTRPLSCIVALSCEFASIPCDFRG